MHIMAEEFHGWFAMTLHGLTALPVILSALGVLTAWFLYIKAPHLPAKIVSSIKPIYTLLENKYYLDDIYFAVFAKGSRALGTLFWKVGDSFIIDNCIVNGSAKLVGFVASGVRRFQTGFVYTYAAAMVFGVLVLAVCWLWPLIVG